MTDAEERILEIGLEEAVGNAAPPDLTAKILDAAADRERPGVRPTEVPRPAIDAPRATRRLSLLLPAAAALLITASLAAIFLVDRDPAHDDRDRLADRERSAPSDRDAVPERGESPGVDTPAPLAPEARFALADRPVPVLRPVSDGAPAELTAHVLEPGDRIAAPSAEETFGITLEGGSELRADGEFMATFERRQGSVWMDVWAGATEIEVGRTRLLIELPFGTVELEPGARARIEIRIYETDYARGKKGDGLEARFNRVGSSMRDAIARLHSGQAVARLETGPLDLSPATEISGWTGADPVARPSLRAEDRRRLDVDLERLLVHRPDLPERSDELLQLDDEADAVAAALRGFLEEETARWDYSRPDLLRALEDERPKNRMRAYLLLFDDPHPWVKRMLQTVSLKDPELWDDQLLLRLASRDVPFAIDRLRTWVGSRSPELEQQIYPACYFALRGDKVGQRILWKVVDGKGAFLRDTNAYFASAAALHALGKPGPWNRGLEFLREEIRRSKPREGAEPAAIRALRALYFHRSVATGEPVDLVDMDDPVIDFVEARRDEYPDAEALLDLTARMQVE